MNIGGFRRLHSALYGQHQQQHHSHFHQHVWQCEENCLQMHELSLCQCALGCLQHNRKRQLKATNQVPHWTEAETCSCRGRMFTVSAESPVFGEGGDQVPSVSQLTYHKRARYVPHRTLPCSAEDLRRSMRHQGLP